MCKKKKLTKKHENDEDYDEDFETPKFKSKINFSNTARNTRSTNKSRSNVKSEGFQVNDIIELESDTEPSERLATILYNN